MGNSSSSSSPHPTREELLKKRGVLVPPAFGTGFDPVPPPSSTDPNAVPTPAGSSSSPSSSVRSSVPHLILHGRASASAAPFENDPAARILSPEHLRPGLWVGASSAGTGAAAADGVPSPLGCVCAGVATPVPPPSSVGVDEVSGEKRARGYGGFLSGATVSSSGRTGFGGTVRVTDGSFGWDASGFVLPFPNLGGGVTDHWVHASASGSEGGLGGRLTSDGGRDKVNVGWACSTAFSLPSWSEIEDRGTDKRMTYYRSDPFVNDRPTNVVQRSDPVSLDIGLRAHFSDVGGGEHGNPIVEVPPEFRSPLTVGPYDLTGISARASANAPVIGARGTAMVNIPIPATSARYLDFSPKSAGALLDMTGEARLSYCMSFDLNESDGKGTNVTPPLVLSLLKADHGEGNTEASATVSQTLTYDRLVGNPMEERCPKIRNTVSWAARVSRSTSQTNTFGILGDKVQLNSIANLTAAATWQLNRGLAFKCRFDAREGADFAMILKRWAHPRVTASILFGSDPPSSLPSNSLGGGRPWRGFRGLGIQIETGPLPGHDPVSGAWGKRRPSWAGAAARRGKDGSVQYDASDLVYGVARGDGIGAGLEGDIPPTVSTLPEK